MAGRFQIIFLLVFIPGLSAFAQLNWKLRKDENGIRVFTANSENSSFKSVKVECIVKSKLSQLVAFLLDIEKQHSWVYNNQSSKLLKKVSENELIFYSEIDVPWPCTDRDYIAHFVIKQVNPQLMTIDSHAEPDLLPPTDNRVRVKVSNAHWDVMPESAGKLKIVYTVHFDPCGSIPAWLINLFITKGPYQTFDRLRTGLADPVYENAQVSFIKE